MARDDYGNRGRDRDDRYGQDYDRDRGREVDRDPYSGPLYGQARDRERDRHASSGDERDVGYGGDARDEPWSTSGRAGIGGGMGREGGGRYAGRPEDDARPMRYDRSAGGDAGWRDTQRGDIDRADFNRAERERYERWREASYREARDREAWYRGVTGHDRSDARELQHDLQNGETMRDIRARDARGEYGAGYANEYGRQGDYGRSGGGVAGRPGGADDVRAGAAGRSHRFDADRPGNRRDLMDRNPGQGFGAFGYSNADERGDRIPTASREVGDRTIADRDHTGLGPRSYRRSDDRIRDDVCERLTMHRGIDAREVDIHVQDGVVTLRGMVEDKHAKRLAEDVAEEVMGVADVHNELRTHRRGGILGALFGDDDRATTRGHDRELGRDATRDADRAPAREGTARGTAPSEVDRTIGAASTGPTLATGTAGVERTTRDATTDASTRDQRR